jgi:phosphoribosylanthranilate isomerase
MALKTLVKVGKITNLSDARYCAGMGVDMLGFRVVDSDADYVRPEDFREIRGWFTGPAVVAEVYGLQNDEEIPAIIENYQPDYLEMTLRELDKLDTVSLPIILSVTAEEVQSSWAKISGLKPKVKYLLITGTLTEAELELLSSQFKTLYTITQEDDINVIDSITALKGIALEGTAEEKPGLKNYDVLASVLEKLEVDS